MPTVLNLISFRDGREVPVPAPEAPSGAGERTARIEGAEVILRTRTVAPGAAAGRLLEMLRRASLAGPSVALRPLAAAAHGGRVTAAFEAPGGAPLRTVLRLVPLTLDQASVLGEGLLSSLAALHRLGVPHGRVDSDHLFLGLDGNLRLSEPGFWEAPGALGFAADLEAAARLLVAALAAVVAVPEGGPEAAAGARMGEVAAVVQAGGGPTGARAALTSWRRAAGLDHERRRRVHRQLAALGASLPGTPERAPHPAAPPPAGPEPAPLPGLAPPAPSSGPDRSGGPPPPPAGTTEPGEPAARAFPDRRSGWRWAGAGAALALALLVAGTAVLALRSLPSAGPGPALSSPSAPPPGNLASPSLSSAPSASARPGRLPLLGPPASPPVQQVQLTASCTPDARSCQFNLTANLGTHAADTVAWKLDEVDRCTGGVKTVASGAIPAPGYYTHVESQAQVRLPAATPMVLIGLAGAPTMAASPPLSVGPPASSCPG